MAGNTGLFEFFTVQVAAMTNLASGAAMLAPQNIPGIDVVVKRGRFPQLDTMAGFALLAVLAFVTFGTVIVFFVTTHTSARRIFVIVGFMTGVTFCIGMLIE